MNTTAATFNISPRDCDLTNCIVDNIRRDPSLSHEPICVDVRNSRLLKRHGFELFHPSYGMRGR